MCSTKCIELDNKQLSISYNIKHSDPTVNCTSFVPVIIPVETSTPSISSLGGKNNINQPVRISLSGDSLPTSTLQIMYKYFQFFLDNI